MVGLRGNSSPYVSEGSQNPPPPPQLVLTRIPPSRAMVGTPPSDITLWGQNFTSGSMVFLDGALGNFIGKSENEIDLLLDSSFDLTAGDHTIQVKNSRNGDSAVFTYSVYQPGPGPQEFLAQPSTYVGNEQDPSRGCPCGFQWRRHGRSRLRIEFQPSSLFLHGQADGTFSPPSILPFTLSGTLDGLVAGDLNGDGHPDLVVLATDVDGISTRITTLLNDGAGNLTAGSSIRFPLYPLRTR